jgi:hypothetical protein
MNVGFLIPIVCFWHTVSTEIAKYKPSAVTNNIVSFIHCILYIGHYNYNYNLAYATHISIGFYIYDLLYICACIRTATTTETETETETETTTETTIEEFKRRAPFILHHLAGMYILNASLREDIQEHVLYAYHILEKSNIMIYISYHLHKEYAHYVRLNIFSEFTQLLIYSYYRLIELSFFIYYRRNNFFQFPYMIQFLITAIYCMGFMWSYKLVRKNVRNFYSVRKAE